MSVLRTATVALLVGLALLASGCGGSSPGSAPASRKAPLISIFEAQGPLLTDPTATLDQLRQLGVSAVRVFMSWSSVAPDPAGRRPPASFAAADPGAYPASGWAPFDAIVRAAKPRGIKVFLSLEGPAPLWATAPGAPRNAPEGGGGWEPSAAAYGRFVHAVGQRYSGHYVPAGTASRLPRVTMWSLWNEPNDGPQLAPQAIDRSTVEVSAVRYRQLLRTGWPALQATGHGGDTILIGELAPYGQTGPGDPGTFGEMVPLRFVRALYCVDGSLRPLRGTAAALRGCPTTAAGSRQFAAEYPALFRASGFAVHPYPGPTRVPPTTVFPASPDFVNLATLPKLERVLDTVTAEYGASRRFPLYSTEYGYFTDPPFSAGAPMAVAADYLNWAEYISWSNPRVMAFDQYLLSDPPGTSPSKFDTGLQFSSGAPKPTYAAWRMPIYLPHTRQPSGSSLEVWGCVRPAPYAKADTGRAQTVRIEEQTGGAGGYKLVKSLTITDPNGYFDAGVHFAASGVVRLAWTYPHGPTVYSRAVPITAS